MKTGKKSFLGLVVANTSGLMEGEQMLKKTSSITVRVFFSCYPFTSSFFRSFPHHSHEIAKLTNYSGVLTFPIVRCGASSGNSGRET